MANNFKNSILADIGISATTVYTAPSGVSSTVIGITLANTTNTDIKADITLTDSSSGTTAFIIKNVVIPVNQSFIAAGGEYKIVLEENDYLQIQSDTATSIDAIISVLEIS